MAKLVIKGQAVSKGVTNHGDPQKVKDALAEAAKALKAAKSGGSGSAKTTVNGRTYTGRTVSVQGDGVYVDGVKQD